MIILTLLSTASATANVGIVEPGNIITGEMIVDRYINTGTVNGVQHAKSWQFLSTPTNGQSIRESWMESGNNKPGYGIQVTGPAGTAVGFDMFSVAPSAKYYNMQTGNWTGISSPDDLVNNPLGYMVFVRGDRTVTAVNQPPTNTTLRAKGTLAVGTLPAITVDADAFSIYRKSVCFPD